jgi:hypothetical protein
MGFIYKKKVLRQRLYENIIFIRIYGEEITERWAKLHNEELHNLISLENITGAIKSRMR